MSSSLRYAFALLLVLVAAAVGAPGGAGAAAPSDATGRVSLPGHVLAGMERARPAASGRGAASSPLTLTVVLRRSDPDCFERYLRDVYDSASPRFRRFLSAAEITRRFGPSRASYDRVRAFLEDSGFEILRGTRNRLAIASFSASV